MKITRWGLGVAVVVAACSRSAPEELDPGAVAPGIVSASPRQALLGRQVTLELGGVATHFSAQTQVTSDDDALTTLSVTAVSPTLLRATLAIGPAQGTTALARLGLHSFAVDTPLPDGGVERLNLVEAVEVLPSLDATLLDANLQPGGELSQGGYRPVLFARREGHNPSWSQGPRVSWEGGTIEAIWVFEASSAIGYASADLTSSPSAPVVAVAPGLVGTPEERSATPVGPPVSARTPQPLPGAEAAGSLERYGTAVYRLPSQSQPALLTFRLAQPGSVGVDLLPSSGLWRDAVPLATTVLGSADAGILKRVSAPLGEGESNLVVGNTSSGAAPQPFVISSLRTLPLLSVSTAPGTTGSPAELTVPAMGAVALTASFTVASQRHVYELVLPTPSTAVTVETAPVHVDPLHMTNVAYARGPCSSGASFTEVDQDRFDGVTFAAGGTQRICLAVTSAGSAAAGGSAVGDYRLFVWLGE